MEPHWLVRPRAIRMLWAIFMVSLALTLAAEFFFDEAHHDGIAGTFGFAAWFGLAACAVLILFAKGLGVFLRRPDTYYDRRDD